MNWSRLLWVVCIALVAGPTAQAQLGGMLRNGEPYWTIEVSSGHLYSGDAHGTDMRLAWGNDFEDMKLEVGLAALTNKDGMGGDVVALDMTLLAHHDLGPVLMDTGFILEIHAGDYGDTRGEDYGLGLSVLFSLPDPPDPWDPYIFLRARKESWDAGIGVRLRY